MESPGGPPVPEARGLNSDFSRSRLVVGVRQGWSTLSSGKKIYCGPTLWAATSPRQCSSGYTDPGNSGSLPVWERPSEQKRG